jgi:hypothetical protein
VPLRRQPWLIPVRLVCIPISRSISRTIEPLLMVFILGTDIRANDWQLEVPTRFDLFSKKSASR